MFHVYLRLSAFIYSNNNNNCLNRFLFPSIGEFIIYKKFFSIIFLIFFQFLNVFLLKRRSKYHKIIGLNTKICFYRSIDLE